MTSRSGRALRVGWLALVAAIALAGVIAVAPRAPSGSATAPEALPTEPAALYSCLTESGAFAFGNLDAGAQDYGGELLGDITIVPQVVPAASRARPDATPLDRDRVLGVFDVCLLRTPFVPPTSASARGALLRLFEYHVTTYWPCLRAHGADPGPIPTLDQYLSVSTAPRLVPFQSRFPGSLPDAMAAARACPFEPGEGSTN